MYSLSHEVVVVAVVDLVDERLAGGGQAEGAVVALDPDVLDEVGAVHPVEAVLAEEDLARAGDRDALVTQVTGVGEGLLRSTVLEEERVAGVVLVRVADLFAAAPDAGDQDDRPDHADRYHAAGGP